MWWASGLAGFQVFSRVASLSYRRVPRTINCKRVLWDWYAISGTFTVVRDCRVHPGSVERVQYESLNSHSVVVFPSTPLNLPPDFVVEPHLTIPATSTWTEFLSSPTPTILWRKQQITLPYLQDLKPDMSSTVAVSTPTQSLFSRNLTTPPVCTLPPEVSFSNPPNPPLRVGCSSFLLQQLRASPQADQGSCLRDSTANSAAR